MTGQPLIQDARRLWDTLMDEAGVHSQRRPLQFNQTALAMDTAANGQGIALAPRLLLEDDLSIGRLVVTWRDLSTDRIGYWLVYRADRPRSPEIKAVIDWIVLKTKDKASD